MADVILGFASSHGPTMNSPAEEWLELGARDEERWEATQWADTFGALRRREDIDLSLDTMRDKHAAIQRAVSTLGELLSEVKPDVVVVFSNPHGGYLADRAYPTFGVHLGDGVPVLSPAEDERARRRDPVFGREPTAPSPGYGREVPQYPLESNLARHLMDGLIDEGIDVSATFQSRPGAGLDGAYNLLYHRFDRDAHIPYVPLLISRYQPNQATPKRVFEFGQAVRRVIERWDSPSRVAVMGSGGLSHQIVDEEFDRSVIRALEQSDAEALYEIDRQRMNRAPGTPETLNWVACAGAMSPRPMTLVDYVPCYRAAKGTGHGNAFGYWQ